MKNIFEAAPVARDECRFWRHPDLPGFEEGGKCGARIEQQQITVNRFDREDDASDELHYRAMDGDIAATAGWTLTSPGPDWFLLAIYDTEDGPVAWFTTRAPAAT